MYKVEHQILLVIRIMAGSNRFLEDLKIQSVWMQFGQESDCATACLCQCRSRCHCHIGCLSWISRRILSHIAFAVCMHPVINFVCYKKYHRCTAFVSRDLSDVEIGNEISFDNKIWSLWRFYPEGWQTNEGGPINRKKKAFGWSNRKISRTNNDNNYLTPMIWIIRAVDYVHVSYGMKAFW